MRTAGAILVLSVLLGACGAEPPVVAPTAGPDDPVTSAPDPGTPAPAPSPQIVRPREGLVDVRPRPWEGYEETGPRTLLVTYWGGAEPCHGLDRVEVDEAEDRVTITLYQGSLPDRTCPEIAVWKAVRVGLDTPLGGRVVIDGAPED